MILLRYYLEYKEAECGTVYLVSEKVGHACRKSGGDDQQYCEINRQRCGVFPGHCIAQVASHHLTAILNQLDLPLTNAGSRAAAVLDPKNSSWMASTARFPSPSETIKLILVLLAPWLIIFTLMSSRPSTRNTYMTKIQHCLGAQC